MPPYSSIVNGYYHAPDAAHPNGCPPPPGIEIQTVVHVTVYRTKDGLPNGGIRSGAPYFTYSQVARAGDSPGTAGYPTMALLTYFGVGPLTVTAAPATAQPVGNGSGAASGNSGAGNSVTSGGAESAFAASLPTPAAAFSTSAGALQLNVLVTLLLVLFIVFPSHLFNRTYEENHDRIRAAGERHVQWARVVRQRSDRRTSSARRGGLGFAAVIFSGAAIGALLDPGFGLNQRTAALYGLIGGVAFAGALTGREEGHATLFASGTTLLVAVSAWLMWVPVHDVAAHPQGFSGFFLVLFENLLASLFVGGLVGLVIGLVPLRYLPGEKLVPWHRGAWALAFAVAVFGLMQIMLRPQSSSAHAGPVPFWTTLGLFLGFGAASISFWAYFRLRRVQLGGATVTLLARPVAADAHAELLRTPQTEHRETSGSPNADVRGAAE